MTLINDRLYRISMDGISLEDYKMLRHLAAWDMPPDNAIESALAHSEFLVAVYHEEEIVGMGRIVGDHGFIYFIADIIVHPHFQGEKVGTAIMKEIMAYLNNSAPRHAYVTLMSAHGKEGFYEKFGFFKRPDSQYGHGMMILLDNDSPENPPDQKSN